ncbi:HEAT repeat-containing protein 1-like [Oppia nitens]|uniref:HEAT repeat-containing protein 1-like n=1 Tax=Oppia nitens TaxID=1686743 RepID=UPI0023DB912B|nr:HEAT repeat-containing protein 1-like [Oppia nitens]
MTSLQKQLARLRVPQTSLHKERHGKASFLYDFLEAKSVDNDMHYAIGVSGLDSLIQLDTRFGRFRDTLFNESSKTLDRSLQSREANRDLDTEIEIFLSNVVTNYFLLNATHKTIEWLIYKYGINEFNADALIASVLPYHETRLFTRLIQTCTDPKIERSKWFWLKGMQEAGTPISKTTLIKQCIADPSFLRFICENCFKCLKIDNKNNSYVTFFMSTVINVIQKNTSEAIILVIIGYVIKGLKSKNQLLRKASLCISAHICVKTQLETNVSHKLLKAIAKRCDSSLSDDLIVSLSVMNRFQHFVDLPLNIVINITENSIIKCSELHDIQDFLAIFMKSLINNCYELNINDKLLDLLDKLSLNSQTIDICIQTIAKFMDIVDNRKPIDSFVKVLSLLELRYPTYFDEGIAKLSSIGSIAPLLGAFKYSCLQSSKMPLIFGLTHGSEANQIEAIDYLIQNFDAFIDQKDDFTVTTIRSLLTQTFTEKSPQVVSMLFGLKEKMYQLFSEEEVTNICLNLLKVCQLKHEDIDEKQGIVWRDLQNTILATFCSVENKDNEQSLSFLYPFLLPLNPNDFKTLSLILDSKRAKNMDLLNSLSKEQRKIIERKVNDNDVDSIVAIVCTHFAEYYIQNSDLITKNRFVFSLNFSRQMTNSLSLIILERIISLSSDEDIRDKSCDILVDLIDKMLCSLDLAKPKHTFNSFEEFLNNNLKNLRKSRLSLSNILYCITSVVNSMVSLSLKTDNWFWFNRYKTNHYLYRLLILLFNNSFHNNKSKAKGFRQTCLQMIHKTFTVYGYDFMSPLWADCGNALMQCRSLTASSHFCGKQTTFNDKTVLSLLIAMHSSQTKNREAAVVVAKHVYELTNNQLLANCLNNSEFIISHENNISVVISKWLSSNPKNKTEKKAIDSMRSDVIAIISDNNTDERFKSSLILLLNRCNSDLLKEILSQLKSFLILKCVDSLQFKTIQSLLSIYENPNVFQSCDVILFEFFIQLLQTKYTQEMALKLITNEMFDSINIYDYKIRLLNELLKIIIETNSKIAKKMLKKQLNNGNVISDVLKSLVPISQSMDSSEPKVKKMFTNDSVYSLELSHWKKFIVLLEIVQSKSKLNDVSDLVKNLFEYLKNTFIMDSKSSLEYLRQLLLNSLINCVKHNTDKLSSLPIESVIECLRESQQKETQKIALVLISSVADQFKKEILDYVITIFTFIGNNLLHCDDQYSIQVVFDTMDAIIPIILDDVNNTKESVINVFIDALQDIPAHRRLHLFKKLLNILGERDHLTLVIMKIVEKIFNKSKSEKEPFLSLLVVLSAHIDVNIQIESLNKILDIFTEEFTENRRVLSITDQSFSDNDRRLIAQSLAQIVLRIVSSNEFIHLTHNSDWTQISDNFSTFLHRLIALIAKYSTETENLIKDTNAHRKRIRSILYQILLQFNSLLPNEELIEFVLKMLTNDSFLIQRKVLELLNEKLTQMENQFLKKRQLKHLMKSLSLLVPTSEQVNQMDEQHVYNSQLSLITCKLLSKHVRYDEDIQSLVYELIEKIITLINGMKVQISVNFKASCILCLSQLMISLGNKAIPALPTFMPIVLANFDISDDVVIISNITSVSKITQHFPNFLSPYLDQIIVKLLTVMQNCPQIKPKVKSIRETFAKNIPKRVLYSAIDSCYEKVLQLSLLSVCELMSLLKQAFESITDRADINNHINILRTILMKTMDLRNQNHQTVPLKDIQEVEDSCYSAFSVFVPKMTEIVFRPFFIKLCDWSLRMHRGKLYYRMISFYRFLHIMADKLRGLFCVFVAPSIVTNCSQMLSLFHSNNESEIQMTTELSHLFITSILGTLSKCFLYDTNGSFLNKERLEALVKPIIHQLTNTLGTDEEFNERIESIGLCVQYMIESNKEDLIIKDINYQILLVTREESVQVRLGAVKVLHRLILGSGEDYLPIIAETIPFISELSEDDDERIEDLIKKIITDLEQILGEPITKYL